MPQTHEFYTKEKMESFMEIRLELIGLSRKIHIQQVVGSEWRARGGRTIMYLAALLLSILVVSLACTFGKSIQHTAGCSSDDFPVVI